MRVCAPQLRPRLARAAGALPRPTALRRLTALRWLIALSAVPLAVDGAELADSAQPSQESRVAAGEVIVTTKRVEGYSIPQVGVDCVIDVPPERVWALVDDCNGYRNTMPRVADSAELERTGTRSLCKWTVAMPFPFANVSTLVEARSVVSAGGWKRDFKQLSGDFVRNEGYWHLTPFGSDGKRTRIDYRLHVVMSTLVPDSLIKRGQISAMHDMIRKMRAALK